MTHSVPYRAPDFRLIDSATSKHVGLDNFSGQWLILYFYPKDDTLGCTIEACSLRDARDTLADMGASVVGISKDLPGAHEAFKAKHSLNFHLLSDPDGQTIAAYGAWGPKMFGREGILRKTFIINPQGEVVKVFGRVTPAGHGDQVIETLRQLQSA